MEMNADVTHIWPQSEEKHTNLCRDLQCIPTPPTFIVTKTHPPEWWQVTGVGR
jgi:hypothetical protein